MSLSLLRAPGKPILPTRLRPSPKEGLNVQYKLKNIGKNLSGIGQQIGVSRQSVSRVVSGHRRSKRIESEIARILGKASWNEVVLEARAEVQKKPVAAILKEMRREEAAREKAFREDMEAEMTRRIAETEVYTGEAAKEMWKQVQEKMRRGA